MSQNNVKFILKGLAGSHSHGLATENSDKDYHGVYSVPSQQFWHLSGVTESIVKSDPDQSYHELRKYLNLALKSNPTILELLFLDDYIEKEEDWGSELIALSDCLISAKAVKSAYMGYAQEQMRRMRLQIDASPKRAKLVRHAFRLLDQGTTLYETGSMTVKVPEESRDFYFTIGTMPIDFIESEYSKRIDKFYDSSSALREFPDTNAVERFLVGYRRDHNYEIYNEESLNL